MKKRIALILCVFALMFSLCPTRVQAEGDWGYIKNLRISSNGTLKWTDVEGAGSYEIWTNDGLFLTDEVGQGQPHETFLHYLEYGSAPTGKYKAVVYAIDYYGQVIAKATTKESVSYTASGETKPVDNVRWENEYLVEWDETETGDVFYYVYLTNSDGLVWHGRTDLPYMNFYRYMSEYGCDYAVSVVAGKPGCTRSAAVTPLGASQSDRMIKRLAGANRYETALLAADEVIKNNAPAYFENVIIANGDNFPDALSGAYLATMYSCPLVLINSAKADMVCKYLNKNLVEDAHISIIGGQNAVKDSWLKGIEKKSRVFERLEGSNRYKTNLEILKKGYLDGGEILVATGKNFADALSASATGLPLLLVGDKLEDYQKEFLKKVQNPTFTIIGGENAVSKAVEKELSKIGDINARLSGNNRYETSALIARTYFLSWENSVFPEYAVLATGGNFPDGLAGGPLAWSLGNCPLLLVDPTSQKNYSALEFINEVGIYEGYILGGPGVVSEENANVFLYFYTYRR